MMFGVRARLRCLIALVAALGVPGGAVAQTAMPGSAQLADPNRLFADSRVVAGDRISVEVVGRGPDVVLIPGLGSSRQVWRRTAERLRGRHRLHLVQVAGFAGAAARANARGPVVTPTVEALRAYAERAGVRRPAVVGHSLGGLMALMLAADHPEAVGRIMIVDSLAFLPELFAGADATAATATAMADGMARAMRAVPAGAYAEQARLSALGLATAPVDQARIATWSVASDRGVVATALRENLLADMRPRIAGLTVALSVFHTDVIAAVAARQYGPAAALTLVAAKPGARHFLMDDDPAGFDAALDRFLGA